MGKCWSWQMQGEEGTRFPHSISQQAQLWPGIKLPLSRVVLPVWMSGLMQGGPEELITDRPLCPSFIPLIYPPQTRALCSGGISIFKSYCVLFWVSGNIQLVQLKGIIALLTGGPRSYQGWRRF